MSKAACQHSCSDEKVSNQRLLVPILADCLTGDLSVQTDTVEKNQVTSAQMWVLLLGQLVFLVWLLLLLKVQVSCSVPDVQRFTHQPMQ